MSTQQKFTKSLTVSPEQGCLANLPLQRNAGSHLIPFDFPPYEACPFIFDKPLQESAVEAFATEDGLVDIFNREGLLK